MAVPLGGPARNPFFTGGETPLNENFTRPTITCHPSANTAATILISLGSMGICANVSLMAVVLLKRPLRRWSQGLLFHQALVDCARAAILMPLGLSILNCKPVNKCSLVETAFLLLVTVSTVNLLTTVLNDAPVLPNDDDGEDAIPMLMDSPQCVIFGMFMIWFASITINLGPTFLSGALAANSESNLNKPSCPLIQGPFRHYILNVLWIFINVLCVLLTMYHLYKLYRDLRKPAPTANGAANGSAGEPRSSRAASLMTTVISATLGPASSTNDARRIKAYVAKLEREGLARVKMFMAITVAYLVFWGPLFLVTLFTSGEHYRTETPSTSHEVTLHVAFVHAFVNPTLFLVLHKGLRKATIDLLCCNFRGGDVPEDEDYDMEAENGIEDEEEDGLEEPEVDFRAKGSFRNGSKRKKSRSMSSNAPVSIIDGRPPIASLNRSYMLSDSAKKETSL